MVLGEFLYVMQNSSGVRMAVLVLFWICGSVVMPYVYSLSRYFWDCILEWSGRVVYVGLFLHAVSCGVFLTGKVLFLVVTCISYYLLSRKSVLAMSDLEHACCLSLGRCREPPYLAVMYLVRVRVGKFLDLYTIFWDWMYVLKVLGLSFDLLRHPVMTHLDRLRSMCAHSTNFWSLVIWG